MKAFSIQQPWASLICCGLKDVENRTWALKNFPVRVLIHAGAKRQQNAEEVFPAPHWWYLQNYQDMGILPLLKETPVSCIVGVATITDCITDSKSIWAGEDQVHWVMSDVKLFKKPIMGVKGKLGIFDIPDITEDNLPECVEPTGIVVEGNDLIVPLKKELFDKCKSGELKQLDFALASYEETDKYFDENDKLRTFENAILKSGDETVTLPIEEIDCYGEQDENGEPYYVEIYGNKYYALHLSIYLK